MAWNEPGGNNNDPWKNRGGRDQGPPDLDDVFKNLFGKFGNLVAMVAQAKAWVALVPVY